MMAAKAGIKTIDVGAPQLAMHSIRETCCTTGVAQTVELFKTFFCRFAEVDANMVVE